MGRHAGIASIPSYDTEKHDQYVIIPCSSNYNLFLPWGADFEASCQPNVAKFYGVSNDILTEFPHQALYTAATNSAVILLVVEMAFGPLIMAIDSNVVDSNFTIV